MHFGTKSYLKSTRNYTARHALSVQMRVRLHFKKIKWIAKTKAYQANRINPTNSQIFRF